MVRLGQHPSQLSFGSVKIGQNRSTKVNRSKQVNAVNTRVKGGQLRTGKV
ncbi:hypothetical protein HanXRQr2_Chr15g0679161 [Helianthus annuus]|uniref:Uncharacterized protein n=1 Tax=Helianthus annuus TaxID=4232 RepID=A0A9K3H159_HELAN|nr:hypothetical protein HanXRQr2_Chr15g0679161 [Helianthus annuus]